MSAMGKESPPLIAYPSGPAGRRRGAASFWKRIAIAALVCFAITRALWHLVRKPGHCHGHGHGLLRYAGEHISWQVCGDLYGRPLECSEIDVPMDQFHPDASNKTFSIPLIRLRGKNATQNILLNPGGPGGSGIEFLYRRGQQLHTIIGEGFHLLSFDPRGVNGSQPLAACYPDEETRRHLSPVKDSRVIEDSPEAYAWNKNFVRSCQDTMGEHGKFINTPQTAADMNSILDAIGQEGMVYWGFSYGTTLGQTYATLFPERSERVIIDGVSNNYDWYEGLLDSEVFTDTENVFLGFADECIKAGKNCTLSSYADSKEELRDKLVTFLDGLAEPLSVYVNNTIHGLLTREQILYEGIFPALYKPNTWYTLADNLAQLLDGNATAAFLAYSWDDAPGDLTRDTVNFVYMNDGASGSKYWPQDRQSLLDQVIPYMNQSLFAPAEYAQYYTKQQWRIPKTHDFVQVVGVETAHPLLILSTTYDPVCPLVSARAAHAAFVGSQIVEVLGYGHCSVAVPSSCLARHVRGFLYNGTIPANYTQCEVDGPYFLAPERDTKAVATELFDELEEQRLYAAQLELARDPKWPAW
jgi:pimeloyl-ACP methyl ester carboxylesterase